MANMHHQRHAAELRARSSAGLGLFCAAVIGSTAIIAFVLLMLGLQS